MNQFALDALPSSPRTHRLRRLAALLAALACAGPALAANDAMTELLRVLHAKGTLDDETYAALTRAAQADAERNAAAGSEVEQEADNKLERSLARLGAPRLRPGRFELEERPGGFDWRLIGRLHYDAAFFDGDGAFEQTDDSQLRRVRLGAAGTLDANWKFKVEYDFRDGDKAIEGLRDAYIEYAGKLPGLDPAAHPTSVKIGQSHEPFSFDLLNSSNNSMFIERALPVNTLANFVGERQPGLKLTTWGARWTGALGAFATRQQESLSPVTVTCPIPAGGAVPGSSLQCTGSGGDEQTGPRDFNDGYALTARGTWSPWHEDGHVLHLGTAFSYRDFLDGNTMRLRERFEVNETASRLIDTGNFAARHFMRWNAELAVVEGPFTLQGEYLAMKAATPTADPYFDGYYLQAGWFLTGESRPYKFQDGIFDGVRPTSLVGKGGWGAWELVARYSTADLSDASITGGLQKNFTVGLNWWPIANVRFMANYVHVLDVEGGAFDGAEPAAFVLRSAVFW
ncbi:MAG TPA: porin [Gammaproteobacteria bacterium]|nr:porin [Gammaproteobacteria bacterium]